MLRHQLSNLSRITSSTLKYAVAAPASLLTWSLQESGPPSPQLVEFWISETERGLDALLDDQFDVAETIFVQHCSVSPFHAVGYALMAYLEAMLMLDSAKIHTAAQRIHAAEELVKQLQKRSRRRGWWGYRSSSCSTSTHSSGQSDRQTENGPVSISFSAQQIKDDHDEDDDDSTSTIATVMTALEEPLDGPKPDVPLPKSSVLPAQTLSLQCNVLEVNCMLMSATIQFLKSSWFENMRGAYKLRKAYKMYEQLFEVLTNRKTGDYAADLRKRRTSETESFESSAASWESGETASNSTSRKNGKRFSLFSLASPRRASVESLKASWSSSRRSFSIYDRRTSLDTEPCGDAMVESGVFFGIGLFSLIFSLLPPKVNKVLNTLGFHSSRPFALHILQKSYMSKGLYSSLSALSLLVYYTNLSLFIHPQLLPSSLTLNAARHMLDHMKSKFPGNKLWELLEGKLCKMEGKTRRGVEIIRDTRRRHSVKIVDLVNAAEPYRTNGSKKKTGTAPKSPIDHQYHHQHTQKSTGVISEMAQLQALAVYEMGWGQIFLGDYFQASETFFQLESISNWSRAFYHYIATCCMFADEQYDKAGMEFHQIPGILERKRQLGGVLLPNELFAERKIKRWKEKAQQLLEEDTTSAASYIPEQQRRQQEMIKKRYSLLDGQLLQQVIVVNPLWELIYLWNGIPYLSKEMLDTMRKQLEQAAQRLKDDREQAVLKVLLGAVSRELADYAFSEKCFKYVIKNEPQEDRWVVPYAMYEMATLCALQNRVVEARKWILRSQQYTHYNHQRTDNNQRSSYSSYSNTSNDTLSEHGDYNDLESRLHIRCQVLLEKLDELDK